MIFRAIFWVGLVALLMPREPGPGQDRPGAGLSLPAGLNASAASVLPHGGSVCDGHAQACANGLALLDSFQDAAVRGLAEVKAEIETSQKERAARRI